MSESGPDDFGALRGYLAANDAPCPQCRYNLRGIAEERCPECGRDLTLAEVTDPDNVTFSIAWWACYAPLVILGVIGVVSGFGFLGMTFYVGVRIWSRGQLEWPEILAPVLLVPPMCFLAMERRWVRDGHLTARWSEGRLWRRARAHWTLLLLAVAAIIVVLQVLRLSS